MNSAVRNDYTELPSSYPPLTLRLEPVLYLTDEQLHEFSAINRDVRIERNAEGELIIMPPTGGTTGERNSEITMQLRLWSKREGSGVTFDSSTGFRLPNGAVRSPDAAWVLSSRLAGLTAEERKKFLPLCPDFVIELLSPNDSLSVTQEKMQEYLANGAKLGWLIDPECKRVTIYRAGLLEEEFPDLALISGDPILPGFILDLNEIW
jgi:Uma2 family endonuclease